MAVDNNSDYPWSQQLSRHLKIIMLLNITIAWRKLLPTAWYNELFNQPFGKLKPYNTIRLLPAPHKPGPSVNPVSPPLRRALSRLYRVCRESCTMNNLWMQIISAVLLGLLMMGPCLVRVNAPARRISRRLRCGGVDFMYKCIFFCDETSYFLWCRTFLQGPNMCECVCSYKLCCFDISIREIAWHNHWAKLFS